MEAENGTMIYMIEHQPCTKKCSRRSPPVPGNTRILTGMVSIYAQAMQAGIIADTDLIYEQVLNYDDQDVFDFCQELTNRTYELEVNSTTSNFTFNGDCAETFEETKAQTCQNNSLGICERGSNCFYVNSSQSQCVHPCYEARVWEGRCLYQNGFECSVEIQEGSSRYGALCSCRENYLRTGQDACMHENVIIITTCVIGGILLIIIITIFVVIAVRNRRRGRDESLFMNSEDDNANGFHRTTSGAIDFFGPGYSHANTAYQTESESYSPLGQPRSTNFYTERDIPSERIPRPKIRESRDDMTIIPEEESDLDLQFMDPSVHRNFRANLYAVDLENEYTIQRPAAELIPFYDF